MHHIITTHILFPFILILLYFQNIYFKKIQLFFHFSSSFSFLSSFPFSSSCCSFSFSFSSCSFSSSSFSFSFFFLGTTSNTIISTPSPFLSPPVSNSSFPHHPRPPPPPCHHHPNRYHLLHLLLLLVAIFLQHFCVIPVNYTCKSTNHILQ